MHTVIGAGSLVMHDVESYVVSHGMPAKVVRKRWWGPAFPEKSCYT